MRQIALDTETTGLETKEGHRIIEIGCVEIVDRQLTGREFHCYINPERDIDIDALKITGIERAFLDDKPLFKDIAHEFLTFVKDAELIAHNAPFDVGFINYEFTLANLNLGKIADYCEILDTLALARKLHPGQRNSLDALTKRYKITHFDRTLHGALLDAQILAQVYLAMTGGQSTLFGSLEVNTAATQTKKSPKIKLNRPDSPLSIIKANESELSAHDDFLKNINEASKGNCLWAPQKGSI